MKALQNIFDIITKIKCNYDVNKNELKILSMEI